MFRCLTPGQRRHRRPAPCKSWVESANDPATRLPDPEPAVRRLPAQGRERSAARRRGDRRPDASTSPRLRPEDRADDLNRLRRPPADAGVAPSCASVLQRRAVRRADEARKRFAKCLVPMTEAELFLPVPHRRLHRLLHRHPPRHRRRQAVPARQPAAAELQVGADRLPRPRLVDRRLGHAGACARTARRKAPEAAAPAFGPSRRLDYELELGIVDRPGQCAGRADRHRQRAPTTSSASCCSTTGRRATSRPGSTSRSGRSSPRTSPPRSRPGS